MIKLNTDKVSYQEINWKFVEGIARRINRHKGQYPPFNWRIKSPDEFYNIQDALIRHMVDFASKDWSKDTAMEHLEALGCNVMFLYDYLLRNPDFFDGPPVSGQTDRITEDKGASQSDNRTPVVTFEGVRVPTATLDTNPFAFYQPKLDD